MTFFMRVILEKNEVFSLFKGNFPLYVAFGRTTPLGGLSTKILLAAFFRFMQILFSITWALTFAVPK